MRGAKAVQQESDTTREGKKKKKTCGENRWRQEKRGRSERAQRTCHVPEHLTDVTHHPIPVRI
eukprot:3940537-Rhodomonas_salina.4